MGETPSRFEGFVRQRRLLHRPGEWSYILPVCLAIAVLWGWGLGQSPITPMEMPFVQRAAGGIGAVLTGAEGGHSPGTVFLLAGGQWLGDGGIKGSRLIVALLNGLTLPLLYHIAKTLLGQSLPALLTLVIYGTTLGVTFWARLATPNGLVLALTLIYLTSVLGCRRDLRASLGLGLSLTALTVTDLRTALLLGASGLLFLRWDTPRLFRTVWFWLGLALGLLPAIAWMMATDPSFSVPMDDRIPMAGFLDPGWLWIAVSGPGLLFAVTGFQQGKDALHWSWGRFLICYGGGYSLLLMLAPWPTTSGLIMPLFAPLSLAAAVSLGEVCRGDPSWRYPRWWHQVFYLGAGLLTLLLIWGYGQGAIAVDVENQSMGLLLPLALLAMTTLMTAHLLRQEKPDFIPVLYWGLYVVLLLGMTTPVWGRFVQFIATSPLAF